METRATCPEIDRTQRIFFSETRMSRLSHPRATTLAVILLAVVFLMFGMFANAVEPAYATDPNSFEGAASLLGSWMFGG